MTLGPGDAEAVVRGAYDAGNLDCDLLAADTGERIIGAGVIVERGRPPIRGEFIGAQPVLAHDDGIRRDRARLLDETAEVEGDLRIGRPVVGRRSGDGLRLAEIIDLHHPGHHGPSRRLQDKCGSEACREDQRAEGHIAPVLGLHASRADALVPDLRGFLVRRLGFGRFAVMGRWTSEDVHERSLSEMLTEEPPP